MALVVLFGLPGCGKNWVGNILKDHLHYHFFDGDGALTDDMHAALKQGHAFTEAMRARYYEILISRTRELLTLHGRVAMAQALIKEQHREMFRLAFQGCVFLHVQAGTNLVNARLVSRNDRVTVPLADKIRALWEAPRLPHHLVVNEVTDDGEGIIEQLPRVLLDAVPPSLSSFTLTPPETNAGMRNETCPPRRRRRRRKPKRLQRRLRRARGRRCVVRKSKQSGPECSRSPPAGLVSSPSQQWDPPPSMASTLHLKHMVCGGHIATVILAELGDAAFYESYVRPRKACIIKDLVGQWDVSKWSVEYFKAKWGDVVVPLSSLPGGLSKPPWTAHEYTCFKHFLETYTQPDKDGKMRYLQQVPTALFPGMTEDFIVPGGLLGEESLLAQNTLFVGAPPVRTSLHFDQPVVDNIFCQIKGCKRVLLFPPQEGRFFSPFDANIRVSHVSQVVEPVFVDAEKYPDFSSARGVELVLSEGDALYIPKGWWHQITHQSASISLNFWFY